MRRVPRWGLISAVTAPIALIGGWTAAAARQPGGFDSFTDTISALAARGATDRWLMTSALVTLGCCHVATAVALRPAGQVGRGILAFGGLATVAVAAWPLPEVGSSTAHKLAASLAFGALGIWPLGAFRRTAETHWALRARPNLAASAALLGLVGWFVVSQQHDTAVGLAERVAAGAQAIWPLVVVASLVRAQSAADSLADDSKSSYSN